MDQSLSTLTAIYFGFCIAFALYLLTICIHLLQRISSLWLTIFVTAATVTAIIVFDKMDSQKYLDVSNKSEKHHFWEKFDNFR
jgi:ABC-type uncharacterized transport system permease subunit